MVHLGMVLGINIGQVLQSGFIFDWKGRSTEAKKKIKPFIHNLLQWRVGVKLLLFV